MRSPAYSAFGLTLVVNHACNLRCSYCYTGAKFSAAMPIERGERAIRQALASLEPGGVLQLGVFGGEPLIEAARILEWIAGARRDAAQQGKQVRFNLTTNGTITGVDADAVMREPDLELAVSCDGGAEQHDRHRRDAQGRGSFAQVATTLRTLVAAGRAFSVVVVVRPDTLAGLPSGLDELRKLGVTRFTLSLDVWTRWMSADLTTLAGVVDRVADLWRSWLPDVSIDWFDTRIAALAGMTATGADTRCGFGEGEVAVAPSGRLYPCERLVGDDRGGHPLQLPGLVGDADDFLDLNAPCVDANAGEGSGAGNACGNANGCRCSNFVHSGSTSGENGLLRALDRAVHQSLERLIAPFEPSSFAATNLTASDL